MVGREDEQIIGVGRFIRLPERSDTAEFAIVVGDDWQGQGLGAELLAGLGDAARDVGVTRLRASMLADNAPIHRLIDRYAQGPIDRRRLGAVCEVEFDVPSARPVAAGVAPAARAA